jgi:hypothetical protein
LGVPATKYTLGALRYDLSKLRAKGLVHKLPHSRRYQLRPHGYTISLVFLKLFERIYAPLTAGLLHPFRGDATLPDTKRCQLDRLYQRVVNDLDHCWTRSVSKQQRDMTVATRTNENKIPVTSGISR